MRIKVLLAPAAVLLIALAGAIACGPGNPGGPGATGRMQSSAPQDDAPAIQSNDILARDARTNAAKVKHILIGWKELAREGQDPRAAARTRAQADELATRLLARVRAGEPIEPLMAEFSEDPGSNKTGEAYDASPEAALVFQFKRLSLRLDVGEAGLVLTEFGWHIIERIE